MDAPTAYTLGLSTHSLDAIASLLKRHGIDRVLDVRSVPYSAYAPHLNRETLQKALERAGIRYAYAGKSLGGQPADDLFYDADGHVRYDVLSEDDFFLQGLRLVEEAAADGRPALLCAEGDPAQCHRHNLVARLLLRRGLAVVHILPDGSLAKAAAMIADEEAERARKSPQQSLFGTPKEPWRSKRPVKRRGR